MDILMSCLWAAALSQKVTCCPSATGQKASPCPSDLSQWVTSSQLVHAQLFLLQTLAACQNLYPCCTCPQNQIHAYEPADDPADDAVAADEFALASFCPNHESSQMNSQQQCSGASGAQPLWHPLCPSMAALKVCELQCFLTLLSHAW